MQRRRFAFTLVELLVVISIIALLVAILLPSLKKARDQTKRVVCASNLRGITQAMLLYATENNDAIPQHNGSEPDYIYLKSVPNFPGEWHLGAILMPYMNMTPPQRNGAGVYEESQLKASAGAGEIFYCPATGNGKNRDPRFPTWRSPNNVGAFMDYAQFWNFRGAETILLPNGDLIAGISGYVVMDDERNALMDPNSVTGLGLYRLPSNVSRSNYRRLPNSDASSEVPVFADYMTSFNLRQPEYKSAFQSGANVKPEGGNHRFTGHTSSVNIPVFGGNYGYIDSHVEWRGVNALKPRLIIDKVFQGGGSRYPTYWW